MDGITPFLNTHLSKKRDEAKLSTLDSPLLSFPDFRRLLGQEIKRSERYCEYLSLLIIDFSSLVKRSSLRPKKKTEVTINIGERIKESIRETDFVCLLGSGRLALILAGTPREGAEYLALKLKESLLPALSSEILKEDDQIKTMVTSYPEEGNGKQNLLKFINSYLLLG